MNTICLTLLPNGSYSGLLIVNGVVFGIALTPQNAVPGGYVLVVFDPAGTVSVAYQANALLSTCVSLLFLNVLVRGTSYSVTVDNNALCCGSQSSSGPSSSIPQGSPPSVTIGCCSAPVSTILLLQYTGSGGGCVGTQGSVYLTLDQTTLNGNPTWKGVYTAPDGSQTLWQFTCNVSNGLFTIQASNLSGNGCVGFSQDVQITCAMTGQLFAKTAIIGMTGCCNGNVKVQVSG